MEELNTHTRTHAHTRAHTSHAQRQHRRQRATQLRRMGAAQPGESEEEEEVGEEGEGEGRGGEQHRPHGRWQRSSGTTAAVREERWKRR